VTTDLETLLEEARALDLGRIHERFRLGEHPEAIISQNQAADLFERKAVDLEADAA
jgi:hypothetical protein